MNELQIFESSQFGAVRTVVVNNEPMFCLADVCKVLEIKNVSDCRSRLNEKGIVTADTPTKGGVQKMTFINESNLYKTIFQSRKESAEKFADWVTSEVLPCIRRTGTYSVAKYQPKATSVGEVANLLKIVERTMKAEKQSLEVIAKNIEKICRQFGIELTEDFTKTEEYEQMTFLIVGVK